MAVITIHRSEYSVHFTKTTFRAYSYQAMRARTKAFSGLERHRGWLWFEKKTFVFPVILKNLGLIEQPSLTNSQINRIQRNCTVSRVTGSDILFL